MTLPDGAASAFADFVRVSALDATGRAAPGLPSYSTKQHMKVTLTPVKETGDDLVSKTGAGELGAHYKHGDIVKYYTCQFEHATPDPVLANLLIGATLITESTDAVNTPTGLATTPSNTGGELAAGTYDYRVSAFNDVGETLACAEVPAVVASGLIGSVALNWDAMAGADGYNIYGRKAGVEHLLDTTADTTWTDTGEAVGSRGVPLSNTTAATGQIIGSQAPATGAVSNPNGVSIEVWCKALIDGQQALERPYFWWAIPRATNFTDDARDFTNAILQNVYVGEAFENGAWGSGPFGVWPIDSTRTYQDVRCDRDMVPAPGFTSIPATG